MPGIGQAASIADVQALEELLDGLDDLKRASVERALEAQVEDRTESSHFECIDADDHELVVEERDALRQQILVLTGDLNTANEAVRQLQEEIQRLRAA